MSRERPLYGACSCGRNHYSIVIPTDAANQAEVYFDDSSESRRTQAAPLTAWLRVPLAWVSSTTMAHFPDETHSSIRRTFTPHAASHAKRVFCGYCGTHLSYWTEHPADEAEWLSVTLGSLSGDGVRTLREVGLLGEDEDVGQENENTAVQIAQQEQNVTRTQRQGRRGDLEWFEEMIEGSRLGRTQRSRRGMGVSADGSTTVQWEVSEYEEGMDDDQTTGAGDGAPKRKTADVGSGDDVPMKN